MADSFAKKVIKNKPFRNAHGQYNFTGSINIGTDPVFDDKFTDRDLYSINLGNDLIKCFFIKAQFKSNIIICLFNSIIGIFKNCNFSIPIFSKYLTVSNL